MIGYFSDKSFKANDCTGDSQTWNTQKKITQKHTKKINLSISLNQHARWSKLLIWVCMYDWVFKTIICRDNTVEIEQKLKWQQKQNLRAVTWSPTLLLLRIKPHSHYVRRLVIEHVDFWVSVHTHCIVMWWRTQHAAQTELVHQSRAPYAVWMGLYTAVLVLT